VVGAGLAGLTCAYELARHQVACTVYEANPDRVGGRCWTSRGWAHGQTAEHGGEFIDTVHHAIRGLATELGLELDDLDAQPHPVPRPRDRYFIDGSVRREGAVYAGYHLLRLRADRDARRIGSYAYDRAGRAARALDEMTADQWLDEVLGHDHPLLRVATTQYMAEEYGLDPSRLSAINMVMEFAGGGLPSDERFHVRGGNDQLVSGLVDRLPDGTVVRDAPLTRLVRGRAGGYRLGFASGPDQDADVVILCTPFSALRHSDLDGSGLSRRKLSCIRSLGMGTNAKVLLQLDRRVTDYGATPTRHWTGGYYDARVDTWDSSAAESGASGVLTVYSGGHVGASYAPRQAHGPAPRRVVTGALAEIGRAVPDLPHGYAGRAWLDSWVDDPYTRGSYAAFEPGQFTRYWGFVGKPERHVHFAGEHTSRRALGYLDGAVESGRRAAREVLTGL
jgi:monoamine oxidase